MSTARNPVAGLCPACGSRSLQVDVWTDEVNCYADGCPRPGAVEPWRTVLIKTSAHLRGEEHAP